MRHAAGNTPAYLTASLCNRDPLECTRFRPIDNSARRDVAEDFVVREKAPNINTNIAKYTCMATTESHAV